jgi:nitroreductase
MMDIWQALRDRHSVRSFDPEAFDLANVSKILGAATRAPSAGNRQPWHFVVVRNQKIKEALAGAAHGQRFVAEAPVVIVICADPERSASRYGDRGRALYCLQDTAAATSYLLLAATALDLGSCWVGAFDERAAAEALELPAHLRPVAMVPIGRPQNDTVNRSPRRAVDDVTSFAD